MKGLALSIAIVGFAVFLSIEFRGLLLLPPSTVAEASKLLPGVWSGSEGWGSFETGIEVEFHADSTYTYKFQSWNKQWNERHGFYLVGMVPDTSPGRMRCAVVFRPPGISDSELASFLQRRVNNDSTEINLNKWYFEGGNRIYGTRGSGAISKKMQWPEKLLWYCGLPLLLSVVPVGLTIRAIQAKSIEHRA
jgi:hypothetical protein